MLVEIKDVQTGYVKAETHNHITTIEFFHPQSNSLPSSLLHELTNEIHFYGLDKDTQVILLRSAGDRVFCSGASFDELVNLHTEAEAVKFFTGFANVINAMRKCPKFIVARVQGKCVGGGVGLAAAADYAIALEGADIKLSELSVGFGPFVIGPAVERKIGLSAFTQLSIDSAMWRNGDWARRKGLFAELHPTLDSMEESIARLLNTLSHTSLAATIELKKSFWKNYDHWDTLLPERAAISARLALMPESKALIEKAKAKKTAP